MCRFPGCNGGRLLEVLGSSEIVEVDCARVCADKEVLGGDVQDGGAFLCDGGFGSYAASFGFGGFDNRVGTNAIES